MLRSFQRGILVGILAAALTSFGLMASPAGASTPQAVTFTVTVAPATWAAVVSLLAPGSTAADVYNSPADFIYSFVCESGGKWSAPIPKEISQGSGGIKLRVKLSANQVAKADKALRAESCGSDFSIHTVQQDYKWASESAQITQEIASLHSLNTTTTTTPPESPGQYEAACTSPTYGALSSPNAQTGVCVTYQAQVFQYDSNTGANEMLVYVTNDGYGDWSDLVELILPQSVASQNFIENDVIQFWGPTTTPDTYTTENNGTNTIPAVNVKYATLITAASS
jgi:hypothetical protein